MDGDDTDRLRRLADAAERILIHDHAVGDLSDDLVADLYADAVRHNLAVAAAAAGGLGDDLRRAEPRIRWSAFAALSERLAVADARAVRAAVRAELTGVPVLVRALLARTDRR